MVAQGFKNLFTHAVYNAKVWENTKRDGLVVKEAMIFCSWGNFHVDLETDTVTYIPDEEHQDPREVTEKAEKSYVLGRARRRRTWDNIN